MLFDRVPRGLWRRTIMLILAACTLPSLAVAADDEPVAFSGRVVELETKKGIADVEVVVKIWPVVLTDPSVIEQRLKTDADGRFTLKLRPEPADRPGHCMTMTVRHPEYGARCGYARTLTELFEQRRRGIEPFFATITLERGVEYSAMVVRPDGTPAANVPFSLTIWSRSNRQASFSADRDGLTDREGRIRYVGVKSHSLTLSITPPDLAPFQHHWGFDRPAEHPDYSVPTDLGRIEIKPGLTLSGRVIDLEGRGIPAIRLEAFARTQWGDRSTTKTDSEGNFRFPPMRPGSYSVGAEGQARSVYGFNITDRTISETSHVIMPQKYVLKRGGETEPLVLREVESVQVSARFVEAAGRGTPGGRVAIGGTIVAGAPVFNVRPGATAINEEPPDDPTVGLSWGVQIDSDGVEQLRLRVPKGLFQAHMNVVGLYALGDTHRLLKLRLKPGDPAVFWGSADWDQIGSDISGIEFVVSRAANLLVNVARDDGERLPDDLSVSCIGEGAESTLGIEDLVKQKNGQFLGTSIPPDFKVEARATALGFSTVSSEIMSLAEGETTELSLTLSKKPAPVQVGDLAPPLLVKTLDGEARSLVDYQGKYVLIMLWAPGSFASDMDHWRAAQKRFAGKERFAMLGLSFAFHEEKLDAYLKDKPVPWPVARFRRQVYEFEDAYGLQSLPTSVLIGPDGRIVAKGLSGDQVDAELSKHLR